MQIFRTPFSVSGTEEAEGVHTDTSERARLSRKHGIQHRVDLERAILFGEMKEDASDGEVRRMLGGILSFIENNVLDVSETGELSEDAFEEYCELLFRYGSRRKLLVAAPRVLTVINRWAAGRLIIVPKDKIYGVTAQEYQSAHGTVVLVKSNVLENAYAGHALGLDMENIHYRPLRDTKLRRNIQGESEDAVRDEYFTEVTIQVELEKTHSLLMGVTR